MGGTSLQFGLTVIALAAILVVLGVFVVRPRLRSESRQQARVPDPGQKSLVYEVPDDQDPAAIVAALRKGGLEAIEVARQGRQRVVISGPQGGGELRVRARAVIAHEGATREVTFVDE